MSRRRIAAIQAMLVLVAGVAAGCGEKAFPLTPTPVANTPVTTLGGGSWSGSVMLNDGTITSFNMTLIARAVGALTAVNALTTGIKPLQAPGTVQVAGNYQTGTGLVGTIAGTLQGTLLDGTFQGAFNSDSPACSRSYTGPVTESSLALLPSGDAPPGCPLTFSVQISRERGRDCHYSISIERLSFPGNGGIGVAAVDTEAGCTWAAESLSPWIHVADGAPKVGPGTVSFTVGTNAQGARDGQLRFANPNQTFTIKQGAACNLTAAPQAVNFPGGGGVAGVTLAGATGCEWNAQSTVDWIAVSPAGGIGPGSVTLTAQVNPGLARQGTVMVAGQAVMVSQTPGCVLAVTPLAVSIPMGGGGGSLSVAGVSGCEWTTQSNVDWITLSPSRGDGNGSVSFSGQANAGAPRAGTLLVAGQTVSISQGTCSSPVTVAVNLTNVAAAGGTGAMTLIAAPGCPWTVQSNVPWITLSTTGGTGNGSVVLTILLNPGPARQGTITAAGQVFTITQQALQCIYELKPDITFFPLTGGSSTATVTAPAGCTWTVAAAGIPGSVPLLVTLNPNNGSGSGTFTYAVAQSATGLRLTATVTLTGGSTTLTFDVTQGGSLGVTSP